MKSASDPAMSIRALTFLALLIAAVPSGNAFSPCPQSTIAQSTSTVLYMNKKKKRPTSGGKGFGSSSSTSSSSVATPTAGTLIQPKVPPSFPYAGSIRAEPQSPRRFVPDTIMAPDYAEDGIPKAKAAMFPWIIDVKKAEEIEKMRVAGRVAREVLDLAGRAVRAGITT